MDAFGCVRVMNFVQKKESVEKSRGKREQSESCEKENRAYGELRELRTQRTSLFII